MDYLCKMILRNCYAKTIIVFFFFWGVLSVYAFAQETSSVSFGKISSNDFILPKSRVIDSNSNAVIIADIGKTNFVGNHKGWFSYVYKKYSRIKILNKKAFDAATIKILLYADQSSEEKTDGIEATCYNNENGNVVETKLDKRDIFSTRIDKHHIEKKFSIPAVKEGSIIEYTYMVTSDFYFHIPDWKFQNAEYPCLWSEYEINTPSLLTYIFLRQGIHPFVIDKKDEKPESYLISRKPDMSKEGLNHTDHEYEVSAIANKHRWAMKDLPAINTDDHVYSPENFIDKIEFQLSQTYDGDVTLDVLNTWTRATNELLNSTDFGEAIQPEYFNEPVELQNVGKDQSNSLDLAKSIYYFVQNNFVCNNYYNKYISTSLQDVIKKKSGNVGEINLLLTAMLKKKNIKADPVLLSTRDYEENIPQYPILQRLNYVICRVVVDGKVYYLDASQPLIGFGRLSENCYNGHARIISKGDSMSVYFSPDSLDEAKVTSVYITNDRNNKNTMIGSYESLPGYYESYDRRKEIKSIGFDEFFKKKEFVNGLKMQISNAGVDSLKLTENPVDIHYEFSFPTGNDFLYFNTMMGEGYSTNPFKAEDRKYPVQMRYPVDETYFINMEIPEGYLIEEIPKSAKITLNEDEGSFEYIIQKDENRIQVRSRIKLKKAIFRSDDYQSLRDFFTAIIKKQSEQIVFKKKK
jgi:hypothetical protein